MGEPEQPPGSSGEKPRQDPGVEDEAREAALMQEILRRQEQHREGGVEPPHSQDNSAETSAVIGYLMFPIGEEHPSAT